MRLDMHGNIMINARKKRLFLTFFGFSSLLAAAAVCLAPGLLIRWRERDMIVRLSRPGSPTAEIRFNEVLPESPPGRTRTIRVGRLLFRLPAAWTVRTGESTVDWSREYWIAAAIGMGSGGQSRTIRIKMSPKLIPILPNPWWKSPGYGSDFVKPWYHSAEHFFSRYPTPLSFDEALARTPAALPRPGSRVSIRRRGLLLLCKPGLGGRYIYEVKTGNLAVIFSLHTVVKRQFLTHWPPGMPGLIRTRIKEGQRDIGAARTTPVNKSSPPSGPDHIFGASLSLYDSSGQWRDVLQVRFNGCSRQQAFTLARGIISGLSFALPKAAGGGPP